MESSTITIPSSIPDQLTVDDEVISVPIHDGSEDDSNTQLETSDQITLHENDDNLVGSSVVDTTGLHSCSVVDPSSLSEGTVIDVSSLTGTGVRNAVVDVSSLGSAIHPSALTGATVLNTGALPENAASITSLTNQNAQSLDVTQSTVTSIEHIQNVMSFGDVAVDAQSNIVDISHIVQQINTSVTPPSIITGEGSQTVQAVTLSDGTTAFIQHPKGGKFLEGQTITLEDGTTAVVQVTNLSVQPSAVTTDTDTILNESTPVLDNTVSGDQTVQLEDGTTAFIQNTGKDGVHALQLEDGTTAYITHPSAISLFGDSTLDSGPINLDQFANQGDGIKQENSLQALQQAKGQIIPGHITVITAGIAPEKTISEKFVNSIGERAFRCNFDGCGRLFTTQHHLKVHERSHTGDRPFKCETSGCGKAFATGYGLKSHTRVHTGEKPYKCTEKDCEKAFKTSGDLQKHVRTHTGERPFKCPFEGCDRSFTTSNIRKVHIRTHTGERPYVCTEEGCGRAFASATNYKNHIRIHTGEKPYVCTSPGCGKKFTEYSSLYKHHVVHTLSKPYVCNRCGKTYRQTSTLAMHKRTAHGEDVTAESEAELYQQQLAAENATSGEPLAKKPKFEYALNVSEAESGDQGTMIISNQTDLANGDSQQNVLPGAGEDETSNILQNAIPTSITLDQLQQEGGVTAISVLENGQQIFVITDPSRLEALQQLTQQSSQSTSETDGTNSQDIIAVNSNVTVEGGINSGGLNTSEQPLNIENTMTVAGGIEFKDD